MQTLKNIVLGILASLLLAACGGGSETFKSTISVGPTSHVCTSRDADALCKAGNCSQCQCLTGCPAADGEKIKLSCMFMNNVGSVPATGCTIPDYTLVCENNTLYVLGGGPWAKPEVMQGARFTSTQGQSSINFNSLQFACSLN